MQQANEGDADKGYELLQAEIGVCIMISIECYKHTFCKCNCVGGVITEENKKDGKYDAEKITNVGVASFELSRSY